MNLTGKLILAVIVCVVSVVLALIPAQIIVWGLAMNHISTGLLSMWYLVIAAEAIISAGVSSALLNKD